MKIIKNIVAVIAILSFASYAQARDQIKIVGSSTVYPYATVVAEKFGKQGSFKTPVIESTGTGGGMKLFCAGIGVNHPDITNASRAIKSKEKALCEKNGVKDIIEVVVGNDGITFSHSVKSPDANFTKEQLWRALAAKVDVNGKLVENPYKKWSDIDASLPSKKIEILIAPPTSGTRDAWNSLVMNKGCSKEAKSLFGDKSKNGNGKCRPCGPNKNGSKMNIADASWKVGKSETNSGQVVTGTQANRSLKTTGNEASTCRSVTGTQYLGAEVTNEFCKNKPEYKQPVRASVTSTSSGNKVTGNEVGRSEKVTGDEPGTCKNVTGTEYTSANQSSKYCGEVPKNPSKVKQSKTIDGLKVSGSLPGRSTLVTGDESGSGHKLTGDQYLGSEPNPKGRSTEKVGDYNTLNGNALTGTGVGRSEFVTGNEPGSCKNVTGDEYIGSQQYETFCKSKPKPEAMKVGISLSNNANEISGTLTGRSDQVTGDEPGTCKNVTGTPYAGLEDMVNNCDSNLVNETKGKGKVYLGGSSNARLTGLQPGIGGHLTGAAKGACLNPTGTPYVGGDQLGDNCSNHSSENNYANNERKNLKTWEDFSVNSPSRDRYSDKKREGVTGNEYENGSKITGPFDMAVDKVTGTEQFRFDKNKNHLLTPKKDSKKFDSEKERAQSRITGEGQSAGLNITGDDWDRGDRVTGTEGASARKRNPTRPGMTSAMPVMDIKRNDEMKEPDFLITGSSGNTREGQLVTFSGGARG